MSTSDQSVLTNLQYALIEPPNGGQSFPSGLWTRDEAIAAVTEGQNRLLHDSLLLVGISAPIAVAIGQHRITLPDDWLRTVSVVWTQTGGAVVRELLRSDSFESDHVIPTWESANATYPVVYHEYDTPNLEIQIAPAPTVTGTLTLLYVPIGVDLNGNGELLVVPDELEHAVRYGALAELLAKDGRGQDLTRAGYCSDRFDLAVQLTRIVLRGWA